MTASLPSTDPLHEDSSPSVAEEVTSEDARKSAEKLLDYLKHDAERASADAKSAEDRARANATLAAGAIPLVTFMRTLVKEPTFLQNTLTLAVLLTVVLILVMLVALTQLHTTGRATAAWYSERQDDVYHQREPAAYDRLLHELQSMWVGYLKDGRRVRDAKYVWYGRQHLFLLLLLLLLSVLSATFVL
jgi:hypothetical protein